MTLTLSNMIPLGHTAPDFSLPDTRDGKLKSLKQLKSEVATVIMFTCNHCPYVQHILDDLVKFVKKYQHKNIAFIAISSNDAETYPQDSPTKMAEVAKEHHFTFPYLFDETQEIAKAYDAACTPDFYIFDKNLHCVYRGRFDDSRPGSSTPISGKDLGLALDQILAGKSVDVDQQPSMGCNIKWK